METVYWCKMDHAEKWYLLWMKEYKSGWAIHSVYLPKNVAILVKDAPFWELDWGAWKESNLTLEDGLIEMKRITEKRINHGYLVLSSGINKTEAGWVVLPIDFYNPLEPHLKKWDKSNPSVEEPSTL